MLLASVLGCFTGIVLGLLPGTHINNILPLILGITFFSPFSLSVFIVSLGIAQIFSSYIPSIFLGAPDADNCLTVLPGHRMLMEGRGFEAIYQVIIGGGVSMIISIVIIFFLSSFFQPFYEISRPYIAYVISAILIAMVALEKHPKKIIFSILIIALAGALGILVLNSNLISQKFVLFPTLTGLFGMSTLVMSLGEKINIPEQKIIHQTKILKSSFLKAVFLGAISGITVGFLPAIGVSQAGVLMQTVARLKDTGEFLMMLAGINTSNEVFSIVSLTLIGNPRSGASVAIQRILPNITSLQSVTLIGSIIFSAGISSVVVLFISRKFLSLIQKVDYKKLSVSIITFILLSVLFVTGPGGFIVLFASTSIGILSALLGVKRSHCMSVLLIPSIIFFLGL